MPETERKLITSEPLPYAASLARDRVSVERGTNYLRVISPPVGSWRKIPRRFHIGAIVLGVLTFMFFLLAVTGTDPDERMAGVFNASMYGCILLAVLAFGYNRVRRAYVFEVTDQTFSMTLLSPWGRTSSRIWRRDAIGAVNVVFPSATLMIQVIGQTRLTLWLGPDRGAAEVVAAALREGLSAPAVPVERAHHLPPGEIVPPEALPRGDERTALLVTAFVLAGFGVILGIVFMNVYVATIPLMLAGIPAGMALGTQKKDYYW